MPFANKEYEKEYKKVYGELYYKKYKDELLQKSREFYEHNKDRIKGRAKNHYMKNREDIIEKNKLNHIKKRKIVLQFYGGTPPRCACCGESQYEFLTLDHINNDGAEQRKSTNQWGGSNAYGWLIKNNFPDGFQILCWNCNCSKGFYGRCPHLSFDAQEQSMI